MIMIHGLNRTNEEKIKLAVQMSNVFQECQLVVGYVGQHSYIVVVRFRLSALHY